MGRNKLTATQVKGASRPGKLSDGDGLYLHTARGGTKSWAFVWVKQGRRREMGLGFVGRVSLAQAREHAQAARAILGRGGDPLADRKASRVQAHVATFGEVADEFINGMEAGWRNPKHLAQWRMTLGDTYCADLRKLPIAAVGIDDVLAAVKPIWIEKPETASRLRGRIEKVLDHAKATGRRAGENPARWKGHLALILPAPQKLARGHHAAMPYPDVPAFLEKIRAAEGVGARALEFAILAAARTGEIIGATWSEMDLEGGIWTVPATRMKAGREHRVPLTAPTLAVLEQMKALRRGDFVFPGQFARRPMSNATLTKALVAAGGKGNTVHGFRSAFRDYAGDCTAFPREIAEAALAHVVGDRTEAAYRRSDALEKRRELMKAWADHCTSAA